MPWLPSATPSLQVRVDVARARRCRGRARSARRRLRDHAGAAHVERQHAHARGRPPRSSGAAGRRPRPGPRARASRGPGWASRGSCPGRPRRSSRASAGGRSAGVLHAHVFERGRASGRARVRAELGAAVRLQPAGVAAVAGRRSAMLARQSTGPAGSRPPGGPPPRAGRASRSKAAICRSAPVSPACAQARRKRISSRLPSSSTTSSTKSSTSRDQRARGRCSTLRSKSIMLPSRPRLSARNLFSMTIARA